MKKFLFVLLIAVIASAAVEDSSLDTWWDDVVEAFKKVIEKIKTVIQWLKDNGFWEPLMRVLEKYGKPKAVEFCVKLIHKEDICTDIVNILIDIIKTKQF